MILNSKKDFQNLLVNTLNPLKDKFSPGCAQVRIGSHMAIYADNVSGFEAFARPLWGLVPLWCGGGYDCDFEDIYPKGIQSGTNPDDEEYWGDCTDYDQRMVEMSALAYGLLFSPEKLWHPLDEKTKSNLSEWLYEINEHEIPESNWLFFRVLINIALKKLGLKYSKENLCSDLEKIDSFYLGNGWYSDGKAIAPFLQNSQKDYYIAFAFHFYSLIYAVVMSEEDTKRAELFKARACKFAKSFIYWFSDFGAAVPYGRSQCYRFAQCSFWSACLMADVLPFDIEVIKGIIVRNLLYWFEDDNIFDNGHIMTVGYKYGQALMSENYNSFGSPYWSMKAFAFMSLPDEHPFWSADVASMPELDALCLISEADMIAARYKGNATLYPAGTTTVKDNNYFAKYLKFAYSSKFGFSVPKNSMTFADAAPDSTLSFLIGEHFFTRSKNYGYELGENSLVIKWSPVEGIDVETEIIPTKTGHIRNHIVNSGYNCRAYDSGFAVSSLSDDECENMEGENFSVAKNKSSFCRVVSETGECRAFFATPDTNLISPKTVIPTAIYDITPGINRFSTEIIEI